MKSAGTGYHAGRVAATNSAYSFIAGSSPRRKHANAPLSRKNLGGCVTSHRPPNNTLVSPAEIACRKRAGRWRNSSKDSMTAVRPGTWSGESGSQTRGRRFFNVNPATTSIGGSRLINDRPLYHGPGDEAALSG